MPPRTPTGERSRDLERLLTFIDAIVAVAITLLVLPLVDLASEINSEQDSVSELIRNHSGQFWAFALSFAVIARVWLAQHELMTHVIAANRAIVMWLVLWTFAIVFLPFPTALLSDGGEQTLTKLLYIGTLTVSAVCLTFLALAIRRDESVRDSPEAPAGIAGGITAGLLAVALVISLAAPSTGYYPLLLLVAGDALTALVRKVMARHSKRAVNPA